ncbi:MAG: aldolase catalytic domain-containing protein [Spirochaetales bacterium]|nr:aldolase catalytic domain-containing protein [Spirochaetales bacterium]
MDKKHPRVIDCTIRDGGLMNKWQFDLETVRRVYRANIRAGVDIMEIGYRVSPKLFGRDDFGPWRFCAEEDILSVTGGDKPQLQLAVMADIGRCYQEDFIPKTDSVVDIYRLAFYAHQIDETIRMSAYLNGLGYKTFFNIMAVSTNPLDMVINCLKRIEEETDAVGVYLADTFGSFIPSRVSELIAFYQSHCPSKAIGFHGHNNTQMALANSLAAVEMGIEYVDASYYGMGRGAGNTPIELLLPALGGNKYDIAPIIEVIQKDFEPMSRIYKWGYHIPYAITGICNQHPKSAIELMQSEQRGCYKEFYQRTSVGV